MKRRLLGLGCGNARGSAEILLKSALRAAEAEGAAAELVRLDDLRLPANTGDPDDDVRWLWEKVAGCDGLILSTPVISRTISARLKLLGDVMLGPNADAVVTEEILAARRAGQPPPMPLRADERVLRDRVAGFIAVGGSRDARWKTLTLPLLHVLAFPMRISVVDQVEFAGGGTPRSILLDPDAVERAARLGHQVAAQAGAAPGAAAYGGDPGLCPVCHLSVVVLRGTGVECATCGATGELGDGGRVSWTDLDTSLASVKEMRAHFREMLATAGEHARQSRLIEERGAEFDAYDPVVRP